MAMIRQTCALVALVAHVVANSPSEDPNRVVENAIRSVRLFETKLVEARKALNGHEASRIGISPALEETDPKFFDGKKADYRVDGRPVIKDDFMYPYPAIQTNDNFDEDFVKDDNEDQGQWEAMMRYDTLRAKLHLLEEKVKESESKVAGEGAIVSDYRAKLKAAKAAMRRADEDLARAQKILRQWEAKSKAVQRKIDAQQVVVKRERKEYEECKKRLAEAQANFAVAKATLVTNKEMHDMELKIEKTDKELHDAAVRLRKAGGKVEQADLPAPSGEPALQNGARGQTAFWALGLTTASLVVVA